MTFGTVMVVRVVEVAGEAEGEPPQPATPRARARPTVVAPTHKPRTLRFRRTK
jgi:hypothetical protein